LPDKARSQKREGRAKLGKGGITITPMEDLFAPRKEEGVPRKIARFEEDFVSSGNGKEGRQFREPNSLTTDATCYPLLPRGKILKGRRGYLVKVNGIYRGLYYQLIANFLHPAGKKGGVWIRKKEGGGSSKGKYSA